MKRIIARWPRKNVLIVALALAVVFGLITRPHVQRYYLLVCFGGGFDCLTPYRSVAFSTAGLCEAERRNEAATDSAPALGETRCDVRYRFEWGY
jgi:hypothetical protein